jgi:hypothetical protein
VGAFVDAFVNVRKMTMAKALSERQRCGVGEFSDCVASAVDVGF